VRKLGLYIQGKGQKSLTVLVTVRKGERVIMPASCSVFSNNLENDLSKRIAC